LALREAILDDDIAAFGVAGLGKAAVKSISIVTLRLRGPASRNPITGKIGCCARAASGHVAAPPSSVMNSRRFTALPPVLSVE